MKFEHVTLYKDLCKMALCSSEKTDDNSDFVSTQYYGYWI